MKNESPHAQPRQASLGVLLSVPLLIGVLFCPGADAYGAAPSRANQPYAETKCNTDPDIVFCEDFNYPQNFSCTLPPNNNNHRWINPGFAQEVTDYVYCGGRQINPATDYPPQPAGSPAGGSVWVANWDPKKGQQGAGGSWGKLRADGASTYANGSPKATDLYFRFQVYWTADYAWPGDPKTDVYNFSSSCVDNKILFVYPPEGTANPTGAAYDAGPYTQCGVFYPSGGPSGSRFADALVFRVGDASQNYKSFPMDSDGNPSHMEYGPFQSTTLRNPNDQKILGRIFRFDTNRWYTVEFRYKLGGAGRNNGIIEAWIDGIKVYSASDLATCGSGLGDCSGIGAIFLGAYHNSQDGTSWDGQQVVDNLIISRSYVGPPASSDPVPGPPQAPTNLQVQ